MRIDNEKDGEDVTWKGKGLEAQVGRAMVVVVAEGRFDMGVGSRWRCIGEGRLGCGWFMVSFGSRRCGGSQGAGPWVVVWR